MPADSAATAVAAWPAGFADTSACDTPGTAAKLVASATAQARNRLFCLFKGQTSQNLLIAAGFSLQTA